MLELAAQHNLRVYAPSTIAVFGPTTPRMQTPDCTIMQPTTMYGITKVLRYAAPEMNAKCVESSLAMSEPSPLLLKPSQRPCTGNVPLAAIV